MSNAQTKRTSQQRQALLAYELADPLGHPSETDAVREWVAELPDDQLEALIEERKPDIHIFQHLYNGYTDRNFPIRREPVQMILPFN